MRRIRGFTLLEVVLGIAAGATIAAVAFLLLAPLENWFFTKERLSGVSDNRAAVSRIIKEVRRIKSPADISVFASDQLSFVDYDNDPVTFQFSGNDLFRNGFVLARNVQAFSLEYFTEDGSVANTAAGIRIIRVRLDIASGEERIRLRSAERIRNLP